ncbi:MAG: tetraacyldisaccharide 4'-kinase [Proteobacteria bacterium]|nr:tetraacyldisaccharide 4'-kinase [Pseudomonadota bacterium]
MRAPDFWADDGALATLLAPLGTGYDLAGRLRRALAHPASVGIPVVCVGNLVAGGAGKTPVAIALIEALGARGCKVQCLTRGYGGRVSGPHRVDPARDTAARVGDEALLLARAAPTWVARDRAAGARAAATAGAEVIVMDDGFQNPSLAKDLSLVVIDGAYGFGNGRVMPAGPLRETVPGGLARAEAVVVLGPERRDLGARLDARPDGGPALLTARLAPRPGSERLAGRMVLAFAGIGRPEKFFATLADLGAKVVETRAFPDHHAYAPAEIESLRARAAALDACAVTTEKDAVRLSSELREGIEVLAVAVEWREPEALDALLDRVCAR